MERNELWNLINKFWVDYCRLCHLYAITDYHSVQWKNMKLLQSCIFLQARYRQDKYVDGMLDMDIIGAEIEEFAVIDKTTSRYCLKRWFPSLVDEESSFFEFSKLLWIYDHELEEDDQFIFAELMIPMLVSYYLKPLDSNENAVMKKWLMDYCGLKDIKSYEKQELNIKLGEVQDTIFNTLEKLLDKYYANLYLGRGRYDTKKDFKFFLENECKPAIHQYVQNELRAGTGKGEEDKTSDKGAEK